MRRPRNSEESEADWPLGDLGWARKKKRVSENHDPLTVIELQSLCGAFAGNFRRICEYNDLNFLAPRKYDFKYNAKITKRGGANP